MEGKALMNSYLLFDLDGTLTNPKEGITKCVQYAVGLEEATAKIFPCFCNACNISGIPK